MTLRLLFTACLLAQPCAYAATPQLPGWVESVGARHPPRRDQSFSTEEFGAVGDGTTVCTAAIQAAIDAAARGGGGTVSFRPGTYLTGALFLKSHVHLRVDEDVTLLGVADEAAYPRIPTRVAGIEMLWPAGLINVYEQEDVQISGRGTIDCNGTWCWEKYWRMRRKEYEPRDLRWVVDYDAERIRLFVAWKSRDVSLGGLRLLRSGFWTVQLTYCERVTVDGVTIRNGDGPSTDGVDIDSSRHVLVANCDIENNDDCICLKAGRDSDGLRVGRPSEYVVIRDNVTRKGAGIVSFGSECSGGIQHVVALRNRGIGTGSGIRFKSGRRRGGWIRDVLVYDTTMEGVRQPFAFSQDYKASYNLAKVPPPGSDLPPNITEIPPHWRILTTPVLPVERGITEMRDIAIVNVTATGADQIFSVSGIPEKPLQNVRFENVTAHGSHAGFIEYARDSRLDNVTIVTPSGEPVALRHCERVDSPVAVAGSTFPGVEPNVIRTQKRKPKTNNP